MMRIVFIILTLSCCSLNNAKAETYRFSERWPDLAILDSAEGLSFDYSGELQLENLLNEPVVGLRIKWNLYENSVVHVPTGRKGSELEMRPAKLVDLGPEALDKVALVDLKIEFEFSDPNRRGPFYLLADVGVMAKADGRTWSFNTNGSPSWDELFYQDKVYYLGDAQTGGRPSFLSEPEAKKLWRSRPKLESVRLARLKFSEHDLHHWYWKSSKLGRTVALAEAARVLAANLHRGYGFEELSPVAVEAKLQQISNRSLDPTNKVPRNNDWQEIGASYESLFRALANLPPEVAKHHDPKFYRRSVSEALKVLDRESTRIFESPDPDVSGRALAEPIVTFSSNDGPFPDAEDNSVYKDASGNIVLRLPSDWDVYRSFPFYNGVAKIEVDDASLIFYIDETGARLTQGLFGERVSYGTVFREGLAGLRVDTAADQMHVVNRDGNSVFTVNTTDMGGFSNGLAWIRDNDKAWYINTSGERVLGPYRFPASDQSKDPLDFSADGYAIASGNVIDTSGRKIISAGDWGHIVHGGFLVNRVEGVTQVVDIATGQLVLTSDHSWPGAITHGQEKAFKIERRQTTLERVEPRCGKEGSEIYDVEITIYDLAGKEIDHRIERRTGVLGGVFCLTITK